ncbi:MAG: lipoprotein [Pseudomonadales bacterium]|nr:lipoprotein [Pseudomonadales bacterium]MBO6703253.1 lipoprotein [Pseudomonadales bacterium]MBO7006063.1 lipoprotein [Pseudomonadales bacterium]
MRTNRLICAFIAMLLLTACGQKGALYLEETGPEDSGPDQRAAESNQQREATEREQADK